MKPTELRGKLAPLFAEIVDYVYNGLELEGTRDIKKVLLSVSFTEELLDQAIAGGYDAILVHHGVFGKSFFHYEGAAAKKFRKLFGSGISLFAYHLPLDAQPEFGHNAVMAGVLELADKCPFECGFIGRNVKQYTCEQICHKLNTVMYQPQYALEVKGEGPLLPRVVDNMLLYNYDNVPQKVFICSGGSGEFMQKAIDAGCGLFVLGEISEYHVAMAKENNMSIIAGGHWRTETVGILKMQRIIEQFGLKADFVAIENII